MTGAILALLAAVTWASAVALIRKAIRYVSFLTVTVVITATGTALFWPLAIIVACKSPVNVHGVLIFLAAGFLHPGVVRILYFKGMEEVGASANASIFATYPLFSTVIAMLLIGERPQVKVLAGALCVVVGAALVQRSISSIGEGSWRKLAYPASAALTTALGYVVRKAGLKLYNEPLVGVALGFLSASILYSILLTVSPALRSYTTLDAESFKLLWKGAVGMCLGWVFSFYALRYADVSVVTPILGSEPLFVSLFSYMFLKEIETVTSELIAGALSIMLGVILVTLNL